ncbi:MAG: tetratricopeptide repeat protein [Brevinemataceae bacterium]
MKLIIPIILQILGSSIIFAQASETDLYKRLKTNPKDREAYLELISMANTRTKIYEISETALKEVGASASLYTAIGNAYVNIKDFNNAVNAFRQSVNLNPKSATAYNRLGLSLMNLKLYHQAEVAFKVATYLAGNKNAKLLYLYHTALALENSGFYSDAEEKINEILILNPKYPNGSETLQRIQSKKTA